MSSPEQRCRLCGRYVIVMPDGRGHPPTIAERKLRKSCKADGCPCDPEYRPGLTIGPRPRGM